MKRITQSLFEEIEKITSGQIEEKKEVDHDKDGDNDFADVMMARMKAGGKSHKEAHKHTRKHNEEAEQEEAEQLDEIGDTPAGKKALGSYVKKRTKQLPDIEVGYQMAEPGPELKGYTKLKKKVNTGIGRAVDRLTKEEAEQFDELQENISNNHKVGDVYQMDLVDHIKKKTGTKVYFDGDDMVHEKTGKTIMNVKAHHTVGDAISAVNAAKNLKEAHWPGTKEYKEKFPKDEFTAHMQRFGGDPKAARATKGRYGNLGPSGSETEEKPENISKPKGRGRKPGGSKLNKMKEETIVKHEDFIITVTDNPTFQDFFNAAKSYVDNEDDAVVVAEAFYKDEDNSIIIESEVKYLYNNVFEDHKKDGYLVEDIDVVIREEEVLLKYSAIKEDSGVKYNYIHHGIVVAEEKGEE
jgi:hypothetical protein